MDDTLYILSIGGGLVIAILIATIVCYVLFSIPYYVLFKRAGYGGWEAFIPFYNTYCMLTMVGLPWWLLLFAFIPMVNFVFTVLMFFVRYKFAICFGRSNVFAILHMFFGAITSIIMACDKNCQYEGVV